MKFLADENFDNRILRGLWQRLPELDVVRVQDLEISGADDPTVLAWAAKEERILLTHDQRTVPKYAYERMRDGGHVAGILVVPGSLAINAIIEDILVIITCSDAGEWIDQIQRLPL